MHAPPKDVTGITKRGGTGICGTWVAGEATASYAALSERAVYLFGVTKYRRSGGACPLFTGMSMPSPLIM
jgi:hypothetical protein